MSSVQPDLAMSLNTLGAAHYELGQTEAALEALRMAAELYRWLARRSPDMFRSRLVASLTNLGTMLEGAGQREAAMEVRREAAEAAAAATIT